MKISVKKFVEKVNKYEHIYATYANVRKKLHREVVEPLVMAKDATSDVYLQEVLAKVVFELDSILAMDFDTVYVTHSADEYASMSVRELEEGLREYQDEIAKIESELARYAKIITTERESMATAMCSNSLEVLKTVTNCSMNIFYDMLH